MLKQHLHHPVMAFCTGCLQCAAKVSTLSVDICSFLEQRPHDLFDARDRTVIPLWSCELGLMSCIDSRSFTFLLGSSGVPARNPLAEASAFPVLGALPASKTLL
ncbi:hypothetical protein KCV07_g327, partial [Aureobasidium melanogenum]